MGWVFSSIFIFLVAWLVAASTDLFDRDSVRVFQKYSVTEPKDERPMWLAIQKSFRIDGQTVVSENGGFVSRYDNCTVFDLENWECGFSDGSGTFGVRNGSFWEVVHKSFIPGLLDDWQTISQFEYHVINCRWDAVDGAIQFLFGCGLRPFLE
jgi:hypothetical protein